MTSKLGRDKKSQRNFALSDGLFDGANVWLIKPNDFNRGRGVTLFNTLSQLRSLLKEFTQQSNSSELNFFVNQACNTIQNYEKDEVPGEE